MSRLLYPQVWILSRQYPINQVTQQLNDVVGIKPGGHQHLRILFLDTFDWRLYQKGWVLQASQDENRWQLKLIKLASSKILAISPVDVIPEFVGDIPDGVLAKKLHKEVYPRALSPMCEVELKRREYVYLNNEGKQYLRLFLDQPKTRLPGKKQAKKLPNDIVIEPIRGYEQEAMKLVNKLVKQFDLKVQKSSLLPDCLTVLKIEPVLKGKKQLFHLDGKESGDQGLKRIFSFLLDTMCENEDGLIAQKDPEFLHDYRIAIRRSRSLLGQVKQRMPPDKLKSVEDEFAWLGSLTGTARDHDVMLIELPIYKALLPAYDNQVFASLESYLREQKQNTYQTLIDGLHSQRYTTFKQGWRKLLENDDFLLWGVAEKNTIGEFATKRIGKAYKRVLSDGMSIGPDSAIEAYHKLRKSCKKLRYLMEMFRELYPAKKIKTLIKELKKLQDDLGELQDLEVHTEILRSFLRQGITARENNQQAENMVSELIERNQMRKQEIISRFVVIFNSFNNKKNKRLFSELVGMK